MPIAGVYSACATPVRDAWGLGPRLSGFLRLPWPIEHNYRRHEIECDAQAQRGAIAAAGVAHEAQQAGPESVGELADPGRQADQHAEGRCCELALDDQRGEGDD